MSKQCRNHWDIELFTFSKCHLFLGNYLVCVCVVTACSPNVGHTHVLRIGVQKSSGKNDSFALRPFFECSWFFFFFRDVPETQPDVHKVLCLFVFVDTLLSACVCVSWVHVLKNQGHKHFRLCDIFDPLEPI